MPSPARVLYANLHLLDRQLIDREGKLCGKIDDLDLEEDPDTGALVVTHLKSGPGALALRLGWTRVGEWLERFTDWAAPIDRPDPVRVPFASVADLGSAVRLGLDRHEVASYASEKWVLDHLIGPIPGSGHDADG
jgi:sporulation protein YlmC with PRC-barrel domain